MSRSYLVVALMLVSVFSTAALTSPGDSPPLDPEGQSGASLERQPAGSKPASSRKSSAQKPAPPLALKPPPVPSPTFEGTDLKKVAAPQLAAVARQLYDNKEYGHAIQLLHYAIEGGADGGYDLACDYALAGQTDAAFYWLQKSALEEGVDANWAEQDSDLGSLRTDARWAKIAPYLATCNAYWAGTGLHSTTLVVPTGYKPGTPIPVLIGMHGLGADPEGFVSKNGYQKLADDLKIAVVGVSGTVPRGKRSFVWAENPVQDGAQIRRALAELKGKLTPAPGNLVAFGFSQGAQMAFEVAFAHPAEFKGAIVLSPGTTKRVTLRELTFTPANKKQAFVCTCGAQESPGNVLYTRADAEFAQKAGSRVELKLYEGVREHGFPADFSEAFPKWVRFVLGDAKPAKAANR
jgi:predicted esterase